MDNERIKCAVCGKLKMVASFRVTSDTCKYCEEKRRAQLRAHIDELGRYDTTPTIEEVNQRARELGMTYGIYSANYIYGKKHDPGLTDLVNKRRKEYKKLCGTY